MNENEELLEILANIGHHSLMIIEETKEGKHPHDSFFLQHAATINKLAQAAHELTKKQP